LPVVPSLCLPRRALALVLVVVALGGAITACANGEAEPGAVPATGTDGSSPGTVAGRADVGSGPATTVNRGPFARDLEPYAGLGAWVDVFDYAPAYQGDGGEPSLNVDDVDDMARRGVRTLYLQATRWDEDSPQGIVDEDLIGALLARAHDRGLRVVGWYLPKFDDVQRDVQRTLQIRDFRHDGQQFDGIAVDIEYTSGVGDPVKRNRNLVWYSRELRRQVGDLPVAAVVLTAVHLEVVNPRFWPDFPYRDLAELYDIWMPMAYWTTREEPYADGYNYAKESVDRLRADLGKPDAPVAPVGGIADEMTNEQVREFVQALVDMHAIGGSFYDWNTTAPFQQSLIHRLFASGAAASLPPAPPVGPHPEIPYEPPPPTEPPPTEPTTTTTEPPSTESSTEPPATEPPPTEPPVTEPPVTAPPPTGPPVTEAPPSTPRSTPPGQPSPFS
jgi:hypothetical protein